MSPPLIFLGPAVGLRKVWQRQGMAAATVTRCLDKLFAVCEQQVSYVLAIGHLLCLAISRCTCYRGALHPPPVIFIIRLKMARLRKLLELYGKQCS